MARKNDCWGIEVGQCAIKAIRLVRTGDRVEVADWDVLPFKKILSTPDLNVNEAIQVNLDAFLTKHPDMDKSHVVVSVPGHLAFARFAKLPPVEPKKIPDIVRFEAMQQIPFPIEQVEWDYQVFQQADSPDVEVGIFAITKERVAEFLTNYRTVNMRIDALTLSPLAIYNAFAYDSAGADLDGTVYMDIGTTSTDVVIVDAGGIWLRTLPIGGNNFTEALVKSFKISFSKAEKHKREVGTSKYSRQIFSAMRPVFADLVQEIQRSIGYYQSLNRDAQIKQIICIGSTFKLPSLSKFIKQQLQLKVIRPDSFKRLSVEGKQEAEFSAQTISLATAYGLALQGVGLERVTANLLPAHIIKQRIWRAKQPWIATAAACVALGAVLAGGRYFMDRGAWAKQHEQTKLIVDRVTRQANQFVSAYNNLEGTDKRKQIENMRRIQDYHNLWAWFLEDVSKAALAAQPQPQTLVADYDQLKRIDRHQRKRIYIDQITNQYHVGNKDPTSPLPPLSDISNAFATVHEAKKFWVEKSIETDTNNASSPDKPDATNAPPILSAPRFEVTIHGSTPYHTPGAPRTAPAKFLYNTFIRHLVENAQTQGRPYRIVVDTQRAITSLTQNQIDRTTNTSSNIGGGAIAAMPTGRRRTGRRTTPTATRRSVTPPPALGGFPAPGGLAGPAGGGDGKSAQISIESLYPDRPLANEDASKDWHFVIHFTIELLPPAEVRQSIKCPATSTPDPTPPPDDSPQPEARIPRKEVQS